MSLDSMNHNHHQSIGLPEPCVVCRLEAAGCAVTTTDRYYWSTAPLFIHPIHTHTHTHAHTRKQPGILPKSWLLEML